MKINFDSVITGIDGEPIKTKDQRPGKDGGRETFERDFVLRDVAVNALLAEPQDRNAKPLDGKEKVRRTRLADKIYGCHEPINISAEDVVLIKDQVNAIYPTLTTARAWAILEGEDAPSAPTPAQPEPPAAE
jgi:hypothetical protein